MTPLEQYLNTLDLLRFLKQEPRHFNTTDHVPVKQRAPMFGLTSIDDDSWLIGDRVVLARSGQPWPSHTPGLISTWTSSDGNHYAISDAPVPPPTSRPWAPGDSPVLAHLAAGGGISISTGDDADLAQVTSKCVYYIGDAFIKMHHTIHCDSTDEHVAINELRQRLPNRTFALPTVLYQARYDDRYFLVTSKVPGETAERLWWSLDDAVKNHYAELIAQACIEVATLTSNDLGTGIDGSAAENGRFRKSLTRKDMSDMHANCRMLNLDVESSFCLFHEDLGPTNVIINPQSRAIGIIDWQAADYVPREWIGIAFARALAMVQDPPFPEGYESNDYAKRVWEALQRRGFGDDGSAWLSWKRLDWQ
ncbi:uncharacterized protein BCR38DRAFT_444072 [Pseudomassariella vexata]|uniref:Aminoglycoside phosphotransferase domain-containing protein n=1 Tax=Pseudomassariella vexata TaxID=1141098 RepID=A0A1Y2DLK5_9PEZI|nr:uncharacterized protein BCR38DRAFT_444072 [Pseudomassariella vexata]ORY60132.1 hypothetical protein BCR38DRAFT_444072 [Pseudomassariella vexata]